MAVTIGRRELLAALGGAVLLAFPTFMCGSMAANAAPVRIVAIGASNTHGWYVGNQGAYPALLQTLLRAKGIDALVINAGVPFDTTAMTAAGSRHRFQPAHPCRCGGLTGPPYGLCAGLAGIGLDGRT